ncbi:hypothetical protein RHGRI_032153 [Rhododendron griersonianum]|uniref:Uncharacterized protein n=1 Tax=Rhododendron griersonianum TaxID=479676 RepID=A0AAV6IGG3_9ERIC|nr:hypothetical protein RHGRI_032153 [Rhododendron griersonianum]
MSLMRNKSGFKSQVPVLRFVFRWFAVKGFMILEVAYCLLGLLTVPRSSLCTPCSVVVSYGADRLDKWEISYKLLQKLVNLLFVNSIEQYFS